MRDALRGRVRGGWRNQWRVVCRVNELPADPDEHQHNRYFQNDDNSVHQCRFSRAANEQHREQEQDEKRGHVHDAMRPAWIVFEGRMCPLIRKLPMKPA